MTALMQVCTFRVGPFYCGIPISAVQEVIQNVTFTRTPLAMGAVSGLAAVRGDVLTVIDLRTKLHLAPAPQGLERVTVIVRSSREAIGLWADAVEDVIEIDGGAGQDPPDTLNSAVRAMISSVYEAGERLLLLLDPERATEVLETAR